MYLHFISSYPLHLFNVIFVGTELLDPTIKSNVVAETVVTRIAAASKNVKIIHQQHEMILILLSA